MFVLIAAALAAATPTASPPCRDVGVVDTAGVAGAQPYRRLDRLPPAHEYLTVYRRVGGCLAPLVVRYDVGVPRR